MPMVMLPDIAISYPRKVKMSSSPTDIRAAIAPAPAHSSKARVQSNGLVALALG